MTLLHAPLPLAHDVHAPVQVGLIQQKPSLQAPLTQPAFDEHAAPGPPCGTQTLTLLQ
jgi:hypothetical protein